MVACIARFWRRDAKYMNPPMMSRNGKNRTKLSIEAPVFRIRVRGQCRADPKVVHPVSSVPLPQVATDGTVRRPFLDGPATVPPGRGRPDTLGCAA
jgi:hypothetical protein